MDPMLQGRVFLNENKVNNFKFPFFTETSGTIHMVPLNKICGTLFLVAVSLCVFGQATGQTDSTNPQTPALPDTIPFVLTPHNNLIVKAVLNGQDTVDLMFHTAAGDLTLIKSATARLTTLNFNGQDTVNSWGGDNASRYSTGNALQIRDLKWAGVSIWENENSGPLSDGKFGPDLFTGKAIEIDFDHNRLVIHSDMPDIKGDYEKLDLVFQNGMMFVEGLSTIGDTRYPNRFLIHSGYAGAVLFDDAFADRNKLNDNLKITDQKELKDSYGNVLKTQKAIMPAFSIGATTLTDIPVGFFAGSIKRQKISVLGGEVIKRFNIVIDPRRENIYLKVNHLMSTPYSEG